MKGGYGVQSPLNSKNLIIANNCGKFRADRMISASESSAPDLVYLSVSIEAELQLSINL